MEGSALRDARPPRLCLEYILVNDVKVDIPSYTCKPGDVISVKENSLDHAGIRETIELGIKTPAYVEFDSKKLTGKYVTGLRNGVWYKYDEDGILFLTTVYKDGKEIQWNAYKIDNK